MHEPFFKKSRQTWYVHHNGKQVRLAKDKAQAMIEWARLLSGQQPAPQPKPEPEHITLQGLVDLYLAWCKRYRKPASVDAYTRNLKRWTPHHGKLHARNIKPHHLSEIIEKEFAKCSATTHWMFAKVAMAMFNWAKTQGHLDENPIKGFERAKCGKRTHWIKQEDFDKLVGATDDHLLKELLIALWDTGARPHEIMRAEKAHLDRNDRCLRYRFGKGDAPRVIYLSARVFETACRLADQYPTGPLWRNTLGVAWTPNLVSARLRVLTERTDIKASCYTLRHSFATRGVLNGIDLITLQQLMGHKSLTMLSEIYAHIGGQSDHLHSALSRM